MTDTVKNEYNSHAANYDAFWATDTPLTRLDNELFVSALGQVPGAVILDLAGGTGFKARLALAAGAAAVDVVDVSPEMMREGQRKEASLHRAGAMRWFEADISKPLDHLPLRAQYDIVLANWPFEHAENMEVLEGMFRNIAKYLKPAGGGRFLGVRCADPRSPAMVRGDLGVVFKDFEEIPGGLRWRYAFDAGGSEIESASMEATYSGSTEIYERHGLVDVQIEPYENAPVVRENPELFESFLKQPGIALVKARKA
ncbi:S-adenosyl-L-methionine-dependent methyltransferase [Xylaria venustula]|nr:S-adenosyl-L-methionine-dependent methyltransferase [Xylaria venustula]